MHYTTGYKPQLRHNQLRDHEHNSWEIVRTRGELSTLRCRECQVQVKTRYMRRCDEFSAKKACSKVDCKMLHIYPQKMSLEERVLLHGTRVLNRVPVKLHSRVITNTGSSDEQGSEVSIDAGESSVTSPCSSEELAEESVHEGRPVVFLWDDGNYDVHWV
eukprot:TRINITY_DN609_c0_g1_i1.p1 TRINITY_DN609_c0_g1~~TRINITY_DN609_c0_g1_i1.p1  ORF type:complete len:160 (+),score=21.90 TRINITY_DN609_c0_g1_i1:108-587(+)